MSTIIATQTASGNISLTFAGCSGKGKTIKGAYSALKEEADLEGMTIPTIGEVDCSALPKAKPVVVSAESAEIAQLKAELAALKAAKNTLPPEVSAIPELPAPAPKGQLPSAQLMGLKPHQLEAIGKGMVSQVRTPSEWKAAKAEKAAIEEASWVEENSIRLETLPGGFATVKLMIKKAWKGFLVARIESGYRSPESSEAAKAAMAEVNDFCQKAGLTPRYKERASAPKETAPNEGVEYLKSLGYKL